MTLPLFWLCGGRRGLSRLCKAKRLNDDDFVPALRKNEILSGTGCRSVARLLGGLVIALAMFCSAAVHAGTVIPRKLVSRPSTGLRFKRHFLLPNSDIPFRGFIFRDGRSRFGMFTLAPMDTN